MAADTLVFFAAEYFPDGHAAIEDMKHKLRYWNSEPIIITLSKNKVLI